MRRLITTMRRALARIRIRCLEIELHDRTQALRHVTPDQLAGLCRSRRQTQRELLAAGRSTSTCLSRETARRGGWHEPVDIHFFGLATGQLAVRLRRRPDYLLW